MELAPKVLGINTLYRARAYTLQIHLFKNYFTRSLCEVKLKCKTCPISGPNISFLGLKQYLIWVFILLVWGQFLPKPSVALVVIFGFGESHIGRRAFLFMPYKG